MTEKVERIARTALWITLSLALLAIPVGVAKSQSDENAAKAALKAELKKAEDRIGELTKPKEPALFPLKSVGLYVGGLVYSTAEGHVTFTNTTSTGGILCMKGIAKNVRTSAITESVPDCKEIKPYDSNVHLVFKFAGGSLRKICPQDVDCDFSVEPIEKT